jgi:hypothetical protein
MIELRRLRRVSLGEMLVVEFESEQTLAYQVQEIVYAERLTDRSDVEREVQVYRRLLPGPRRLTATLFVELDDPRRIRQELARLRGIQHAVRIEAGDHVVAGVEIPAPDEEPGGDTVTVHLLAFDFPDRARAAFLDASTPARVLVDHPDYAWAASLDGALRQVLAGDLAEAN